MGVGSPGKPSLGEGGNASCFKKREDMWKTELRKCQGGMVPPCQGRGMTVL